MTCRKTLKLHLVVKFARINPLQLKVYGVKFSLSELGRIFFTKIRNCKLFKMPKL